MKAVPSSEETDSLTDLPGESKNQKKKKSISSPTSPKSNLTGRSNMTGSESNSH